jgi:hypothetical protein
VSRRPGAGKELTTGAGGTLTVSDGRRAASIAFLGNYTADTFVTTARRSLRHLADGDTPQAASQQPHLTHPDA